MGVRLFLILSLTGVCTLTWAAASNSPRDNWIELSGRVDIGYNKALRCEAGARKSDRSQCKDFSAYMKLFYPRISFLNTSIGNLPPQQLQKVVAARDYDAYKVKFNKIAEVSSDYGD